jgi:hypothetical protein
MSDLYILGPDGEPVREHDVVAWGEWFEANRSARRIAHDFVANARVSTVFLGLDHSYFPDEKPLLFETMVFCPGCDLDQEMERYSTRAEALVGHRRILERVREAVGN